MVLALVMVVVIWWLCGSCGIHCVGILALAMLWLWHQLWGGSDCWNFDTGCVVGWALIMWRL